MPANNSTKSDKLENDYRNFTLRKLIFIAICLVTCFLSIGISVTVGARELSIGEVYSIIFNHLSGHTYQPGTQEWLEDFVVWKIRLSRALFAIIAGAGLAIAGAVMQGVMKNPLAGPYTTGTSSGACFGMAVAVTFGFTATGGTMSIPVILNAFTFSLIPMGLMLFLAPRENISPATLILTGVAVSYLFNALTTIMLLTLDESLLADIYEWRVGSFANITWHCLPLTFTLTAISSVLLYGLSNKLNAISIGEKEAHGLGINVDALRLIMLSLASLIVASIVIYAGILSFIGLLAPHIVRQIIGADNRFLLPGSALFGASLLLFCDIFTRIISDVDAVPVGIIVSFVGAPIFLIIIILQSKNVW